MKEELEIFKKPWRSDIGRVLTQKGIPYFRLIRNIFQIGLGYRQRRVIYDDINSAVATKLCQTKDYTKHVLRLLGIPVPEGTKIRSIKELKMAFRRVKKPVVIKPVSEMWGRGVTTGITTLAEAIKAYKIAHKYSPFYVLMEEQLLGDDFRILFIGGRYIAALKRVPPFVIGDGISTIKELIEKENLKRQKSHRRIKPILLDETVEICLRRQGFYLGDVLPAGTKIKVRMTANICSGGYSYNVSDKVHPSIIQLCREIVHYLDLEIAGIDIITPDISRPLSETGGKISEVNENPDVAMHHYPFYGKKINTAQIFVNYLFPQPQDAWIPIKRGLKIIKTPPTLNRYLMTFPKRVVQKKEKDARQRVVIKNPEKPLLNYLLHNLTIAVDL